MPNPLPENELPPVPYGLKLEIVDDHQGHWVARLTDHRTCPFFWPRDAANLRALASWLEAANGVDVPKSIEWLTIIPALGLDPERSHSTDEVLAHIAQLQDAAKIGRAAVSNAMEDDAFGLLRDLIVAARCVGTGALARIAARVTRGSHGK